jgi:hypothetical protein
MQVVLQDLNHSLLRHLVLSAGGYVSNDLIPNIITYKQVNLLRVVAAIICPLTAIFNLDYITCDHLLLPHICSLLLLLPYFIGGLRHLATSTAHK